MKRLSITVQISVVVLVFVCFSDLHSVMCRDIEEIVDYSSIAPMEREEQEALYTAIQGFVGKWWNGSNLYPDPCGWTPIQACYFF